jgi:hypothetical protein
MTLSDALALVVLGLVFVVTLPRYPALWRGGQAIADTERFYRAFWPYGEPALQGWLRAQVAGLLDFAFVFLGGTGAILKPLVPQADRFIPEAMRLIGVGGFGLTTAIVISIVLFNVPKRFVIPEMREQEGLVAHWRRSRRRDAPKDHVTFRDAD